MVCSNVLRASCAILCALVSLSAESVERPTTFRWNVPGAQVPHVEIGAYRLFHLVDGARVAIASPDGNATSWEATLDYPAGEQCFVLVALNLELRASAESNVACVVWEVGGGGIVVTLAVPLPPTDFRIDL